jgi:hypothetical protein
MRKSNMCARPSDPVSLEKPMDSLLHRGWQTPELPGGALSSARARTDWRFTGGNVLIPLQPSGLAELVKVFQAYVLQ